MNTKPKFLSIVLVAVLLITFVAAVMASSSEETYGRSRDHVVQYADILEDDSVPAPIANKPKMKSGCKLCSNLCSRLKGSRKHKLCRKACMKVCKKVHRHHPRHLQAQSKRNRGMKKAFKKAKRTETFKNEILSARHCSYAACMSRCRAGGYYSNCSEHCKDCNSW